MVRKTNALPGQKVNEAAGSRVSSSVAEWRSGGVFGRLWRGRRQNKGDRCRLKGNEQTGCVEITLNQIVV